MRSSVNPSVDAQVFRRTAAKTRLVNVVPVIMRGGYRL